MPMKRFLLFFLALSVMAACRPQDRFVSFSGYAQGGVYQVTANLSGVRMADKAIQDSIDAILFTIDTTLSGYNKGSVLSRFNRGETIRPSAMFIELYDMARYWYERSEGALDMAAGPLFNVWGFGFKEGKMPSDEEVGAILGECGMKRLRPDMRDAIAPDGTLAPADLLLSGGALPQLNYNAIAQGYTSDVIAAFLYRIGVKDMLVNIGEIWCDGHNVSGRSWTVGIDSPVDGNDSPGEKLEGKWGNGRLPRGIVTSGNYRKFYIRDGKKYAHTIDPRAGYPVEHSLLSATVVSSVSSAAADAVATWCMVEGEERSREIIASDPSLEGLLISSAPDGSFATWSSEGFMCAE